MTLDEKEVSHSYCPYVGGNSEVEVYFYSPMCRCGYGLLTPFVLYHLDTPCMGLSGITTS